MEIFEILNLFKTEIFDKDIVVAQFPSNQNPASSKQLLEKFSCPKNLPHHDSTKIRSQKMRNLYPENSKLTRILKASVI